MRLWLKRLKSWLKCPSKQEIPRVFGPSDNFISLQRLNKFMVNSSKKSAQPGAPGWDVHTAAPSRASAPSRWWQWALGKVWQSGQGIWSILSMANVEWKSLFFLLADHAGSQFQSLNCPRVGGQRSAAFRRDVAGIGNQWTEKSCLSLSLCRVHKTRGKLVLPLWGLYLIPDKRETLQSLGLLTSCYHSPWNIMQLCCPCKPGS